jgi:hypothetical protein
MFKTFFLQPLTLPSKKSWVLIGCEYENENYVVELSKLIKYKINQI